MFKDDETPEQVALRVSSDLRAYMERNAGVYGVDLGALQR